MKAKTLMSIAAHCDDIELNFGATMLKYHEAFGYEIAYVLSTNNMSGQWSEATEGERAGHPKPPGWITEKRTISAPALGRLIHTVPWYHEMPQRKREAEDAARECFDTVPIHLDYAQRHYTDRNLNKVDLRYGAPAPECYDRSVPTIMTACDDPAQVERVATLIREKDPEVILTHAAVDYTFEHTGTTLLVKKAFIKARAAGYDGSLLCAANPGKNSMGRFYDRWDTFVDTTGYFEKKKAAIGKHACQMPYPDRLMLFDAHAARICGIGQTAESFVVVSLSETRDGPLTRELAERHRYCTEHWMELFFSEKAESVYADFEAQCREAERKAAGGTGKPSD